VAVGVLAPLQLALLAGRRRGQGAIVDPQGVNELLVQHPRVAAGDRAHGQLLVSGHAELSHQEGVEAGVERLGHLEPHRHAPAREPEDDHVRLTRVPLELRGQTPAGLTSVLKAVHHHTGSQTGTPESCSAIRY
jgi:hypothetical protein